MDPNVLVPDRLTLQPAVPAEENDATVLSVPATYTVPSAPTPGFDATALWKVADQVFVPPDVSIAYSLKSYEPTYKVEPAEEAHIGKPYRQTTREHIGAGFTCLRAKRRGWTLQHPQFGKGARESRQKSRKARTRTCHLSRRTLHPKAPQRVTTPRPDP